MINLVDDASSFRSSSLSSPDGEIQINLTIKEKLEPYPSGRCLYYSVLFRGKEIILDSPLGLDFKNMPPIARDLVIERETRRVINETWEAVHGKCKRILDHCNELHLWIEEEKEPKRRLELILRAYNDGVAFRYFFPKQPGMGEFRLTSERSEFHFAANHTVWAADYGSYVSPQESEFEKRSLSQILPSSIIGLPLLIKVDESCWVALTEANLTDWAGMYLAGLGVKPYALVTTLSPRPDEPGVLVRATTPHYSPWRVIMIGQKPGDLIESNIILNLNEPCAIKDTSWITPGKSAWDRWWCGDYLPDADFEVGMNTATMKYFTRFAADMGFKYVLVDWKWYGDPEDPEADITTPIPELDMQELLRFAKERNVRVILWLRWNHVDRQMDEAFPLYEKWGIAGVKIDFMNRDDQEMVNFYHRVLKKAAEHHLIVDFHGAYKPTGIRRTYPNLTREGVLGNEYNKWSDRVTPEHNVTIPFTRMLAGPMDFTPGGFRHATKKTFRAQNSAPFVMGTRCHQLAMMVVYESPLQVLCDSPYNYRGQAGLEFLRVVPTTWDETKVIHGQVGDYIAIVRKSGEKWFIGCMTDWDARTLEIPLDFLDERRYVAHIFADAPEADDYPDRVHEEKRIVTARDVLYARMAPGGGYAACLSPVG